MGFDGRSVKSDVFRGVSRVGPRVVLLVPVFPKLSETFIVGKFTGLLARGVDVWVLAGRIDEEALAAFPQLADPEVRARVHCHRDRPSTGALFRALAAGAAAAGRDRSRMAGMPGRARVAAAAASLDADLVHIEFGSLAPPLMDHLTAAGVGVTVSFRGSDINTIGVTDPGFYEPVWRGAGGIHVLGPDLRARALERGCPEGMPVVVIPPAVDTRRFTPGEPRRDSGAPLRLLSVARLTWQKGHEHLLLAVRDLLDRGIPVELLLAGDGPARSAVVHAVEQLDLTAHVTLLGATPPEQVPDLLHSADVFVHAAVTEGFCNAVLEAQACGLPVVATDAGGLPENVVHDVTGILVPRRDPRAFADAVERLAVDPALRARMGVAGAARAQGEFGLEAQAEQWECWYLSMVDRSDR